MKYVLALVLVFSPILHAETECVSEAKLKKVLSDVQEIYKYAEESNHLSALRLYHTQVEKLDNTLMIRNILVKNSDINSIRQIDELLTNQAQFVYDALPKMTEESLRKRAVRSLKHVSLSNERLQFSVKYGVDVNHLN